MADTGTAPPLLTARGLGRTYRRDGGDVIALHDVDLDVHAGSLVIVRGRSGSGKTTLRNLLGGLDDPTTGSVRLDGEPVSDMDEAARSDMRRTKIGFVFQAFGLLPILSAAENVEIPMRLVRADPAARRARAAELLEHVELGARARHRPDELSGGEQQRVAIARALANRPRLLIADEPTGQLDSRTGSEIISLLVSLVHGDGIGAIVATHDPAPLELADRVIELDDGRIVSDDRR